MLYDVILTQKQAHILTKDIARLRRILRDAKEEEEPEEQPKMVDK